LLRPIRIVAERGSLANPTFPCFTIARATPGNMLCDKLMRALAPVCPDRVAAGTANLKGIVYGGVRHGNYWVYMPTPATTRWRTSRLTCRCGSTATN
jgi:N-methylhydantoinase B